MVVLWQEDVYLRTCRADGLREVSLYLIGPEDLSLVIAFLLAAQRVAVLPSGPIAFGVYLSDYTCLVDRHRVGPGLPLFAYLRRDTSWAIPWPSSFAVLSTLQAERALGPRPWAARRPRAYWLGTVTGPWELVPDAALAALPRLRLLRLARAHPEQLQAEWSGLAAYGIGWVRGTGLAGLLANASRSVEDLTGARRSSYKSLERWDHFKYYVNLDGVVMGGRLNKLLALGGVVLQQKAGYYEHLDALVQPYVHYVPIEYDLSDLVAKVEWLQRHDAEAHRIASRGQSLATQRMRLEDHLCYIWRALEAIGARTAVKQADAAAVEKRLRELSFQRVTVVNGSMRETLERFWGGKLQGVATGDRVMSKTGIRLLQWVWDRFGAISRRTRRQEPGESSAFWAEGA